MTKKKIYAHTCIHCNWLWFTDEPGRQRCPNCDRLGQKD